MTFRAQLPVVAAFAFFAGCTPAPGPETVTIHLDVPIQQSSSNSEFFPASASPGKVESIGSTPTRRVQLAPEAEPIETAIYSEAYRAAVRNTLESLYVSEVDERFTANRAALFVRLKPETEAVENRLYSVFRQNANPVGRHRTRLAWLADFPDPGPPTSFTLARQNFIERQYTALAAAERAAIESFEAEYRNLVRQEFEAIRQQYRLADSSLLSDYYREVDLAKDKAVSRADKITEPEPTPPAIEEFAARSYLFAGSESATLSIPTVLAPRVSLDAGPVHSKITDRLERDRAALFAKVNGLVLSRSAPKDATKEFHRWKGVFGATP